MIFLFLLFRLHIFSTYRYKNEVKSGKFPLIETVIWSSVLVFLLFKVFPPFKIHRLSACGRLAKALCVRIHGAGFEPAQRTVPFASVTHTAKYATTGTVLVIEGTVLQAEDIPKATMDKIKTNYFLIKAARC